MVIPSEVHSVLNQLAVATNSTNGMSQFPRDLEIANEVLDNGLDYYTQDLSSNSENPQPLNVVSIMSIILNPLVCIIRIGGGGGGGRGGGGGGGGGLIKGRRRVAERGKVYFKHFRVQK